MERKRYFKEEFIGDRRFELFKRDPLANKMESLFRNIYSDNNLPTVEKEKTLRAFDYFSHSDNISDDEKDTLSHRLEKLCKELMKKWNCHFIPNWSSQHIPSEPFSWFIFSSGAFTVVNAEEFLEEGDHDDRGNIYIPAPPGSIPIIVDVGGLTEKDKDKVTKEI